MFPYFAYHRIPSLALFVTTVLCNSASADKNPVASLLDTLTSLSTVEMRCVTNSTVSSTDSGSTPIRSKVSTVHSLFRRMGDRALLSCKFTGSSPEEARSSWSRDDTVVLESGEIIHFQLPDANRAVSLDEESCLVSMQSKQLVGFEAKGGVEEALWSSGRGAILFGMLGYAPLADYLRVSADISVSETQQFAIVDSVSRYGHLKLWLDRDYGFLPRKLQLTKQGADLLRRGPIDEIVMKGDGTSWPSGHIKEAIWSADDIVLDRSEGIPYIQHIVLRCETISEASLNVEKTLESTVTEVDFSPHFRDSDLATDLDIPAGVPVHVMGASHLKYAWDGRKAIPKVSSLQPLHGYAGKGNALGWRTILLYANGFLLIVIVTILAIKRRTS